MELTYELFHQELREFEQRLEQVLEQRLEQVLEQRLEQVLEQRLEQKLEEVRKSIVRWIIGVFLGGFLPPLFAIGFYTYTFIGTAGLWLPK